MAVATPAHASTLLAIDERNNPRIILPCGIESCAKLSA
jgi:hypothetical protein